MTISAQDKLLVKQRWRDPHFLEKARLEIQRSWSRRQLHALDLRGVPLVTDASPDWLLPYDLISMEVESADLSMATINCSLAGSNFKETRFAGATFDQPSFYDATMTRCDFSGCQMSNPYLQGAKFMQCDFSESIVRGRGGLPSHDAGKRVTFAECNFRNVTMNLIKMAGVTFAGCLFENTVFRRCYVFNWRFSESRGDEPRFVDCEYKGMNNGLTVFAP